MVRFVQIHVLRPLAGWILLAGGACLPEQDSPRLPTWYKGNTHAHTRWDNGDALPEEVAGWYRDHGYHFLALSDHNQNNAMTGEERWLEGTGGRVRLRTFAELAASLDRPGRFLLLPGEELGDSFEGKLIHHNIINGDRIILPPGGSSVREELSRAVHAAPSRTAIVHLNHPNLGWAVNAEDLAAVPDERFFEVYNGNPVADNAGDAGHPSTEKMWDLVLTARLRSGQGPLLYGVASDDAHHYGGKGAARPGRGWVMVRSNELSALALVRAMAAGDFYASTGVTLREVCAEKDRIEIEVDPRPGAEYVIRFVGSSRSGGAVGRVLAEVKGSRAVYRFTGDELYVRAIVTSDQPPRDPSRPEELETAWVQPVRGGEK